MKTGIKNSIGIFCIKIFLSAVFILLIGCENKSKQQTDDNISENMSCVKLKKKLLVRGNSLYPMVKNGDQLMTLFNYYDCNAILREDLILFRFGKKISYSKIVKGIQGDSFDILKNENNRYNIYINKKIIKNSQNLPYDISEKKIKMLQYELKTYKGKIPNGKYLIMGDVIGGTSDSTYYGLVSRKNILAKLKIINTAPKKPIVNKRLK